MKNILTYGTAVPMAYKEGESLLNLLEFFRKYPDEKGRYR